MDMDALEWVTDKLFIDLVVYVLKGTGILDIKVLIFFLRAMGHSCDKCTLYNYFLHYSI